MGLSKSQLDIRQTSLASSAVSPGLQWLWQHLSHLPHPHILECGPVYQATLDVLLLRGAKLYVADLVTPAQNNDPAFWLQQEGTAVFLTDRFLAQLPAIPRDSLAAICCWGLLDLLPRAALPALVEHFHSYLQPGGVLFGILREPQVTEGSDARWWFESLTVLASGADHRKPFLYPALTNREVERLFPGGNVKTFLTRSGRREVLGIKF